MLKNTMQAESHICRPDVVPGLPVSDLCSWPSDSKATKAEGPLARDGMEVGWREGARKTPKSTGKKGVILPHPHKGGHCASSWFHSPCWHRRRGRRRGLRSPEPDLVSLAGISAARGLASFCRVSPGEGSLSCPFPGQAAAASLIGPRGHQSPPPRRLWTMTRLGGRRLTNQSCQPYRWEL